jgi:D-glycero-D-manno-heptose 1,7-bisphosphate phosphatase
MMLYLFDVDGTLVQTRSGEEHRAAPDDWQLLPGRVEKLASLQGPIALVTNQGGVAMGIHAADAMHEELHKLAELVGAQKVLVCYSHPQGTVAHLREDSYMRKPNPGMLLKAMLFFATDPVDTLFVGDMPTDAEAALRAGCKYQEADAFFA